MTYMQLRDGFSLARTQARERIESAVDLGRLFSIIDSDPAIVGAGVIFIDSDINVVTLREFQPICSVSVKRLILREAPAYMAMQEFARDIQANPRESKLLREAAGMAFSCVGAYLSWQVVYGGVTAAPITLGVSLVFSAVGVASALSASSQCGIGFLRVAGETIKPEVLDSVDSNEWYVAVAKILDGIALAGAVASSFVTIRYVMVTKSATGKMFPNIIREMSYKERARLSAEIHWLQKELVVFPKAYTQEQIQQQAMIQLKDALASFLSVTGSLMSGHLKPLAIAIYGEF